MRSQPGFMPVPQRSRKRETCTLDRRGLMAGGLVAGLVPRAAWARLDIGGDRAVVDAFVRETGFNGVVATARAGKIDYFRAFGMADVAAKRPARQRLCDRLDLEMADGGRVRALTIAGKPVLAGWETGRSQKTLDLFADKLFGAAPRPD
jgi:hypothetical protein